MPLGFSQSARLGGGKYFVVEADEYDSAFFDKRSKFVHYHPKTAILNNLEFDHADIFDDLAAIQKQFHHLVRTIPSTGRIIAPITETHIDEVLEMGCWTPVIRTGLDTDTQAELYAELIQADGSHFKVLEQGKVIAEVQWSMTGQHSVANALATIAAQHVGVSIVQACEALSSFGVSNAVWSCWVRSGVSKFMMTLHIIPLQLKRHWMVPVNVWVNGAFGQLLNRVQILCVWVAIKTDWPTRPAWQMR